MGCLGAPSALPPAARAADRQLIFFLICCHDHHIAYAEPCERAPARSIRGLRFCVRMGRLTGGRTELEGGREADEIPKFRPDPTLLYRACMMGRSAVHRRACKSLTLPLLLPLRPASPAYAEPSLHPAAVLAANDVSSSIFQGLQVQFSNGNRERWCKRWAYYSTESEKDGVRELT